MLAGLLVIFILYVIICFLFLLETLEGYDLSHIMRKPVMPYANNKGTDQTAHLCSLISAVVVRCLDSIIPPLAIAEISRLANLCI